jgi:hypothetical protein
LPLFTPRSKTIHMESGWSRKRSICFVHSTLSKILRSKSEPFQMTRPFAEPIKLTFGHRSSRLHQHPAFCGGGSGRRSHSSTLHFQPNGCPVRPPGSSGADQAPRNSISGVVSG